MKKINFVFGVHNHQPVGNFDEVFEKTYQNAYKPFLDIVKKRKWFRFAMHNSGPLLEWLEPRHPEFFQDIRDLVRENRVEVVGGGFYEPILLAIPERDRKGQLTSFRDYLEKKFECKVNGIWTPERVWEQSLVPSLASSGCRYTALDDFLFKAAGLRDENLSGFYFTEEDDSNQFLFPISEKLRYSIPFCDPEQTIEHLRSLASDDPDSNRVVVYMDDGEKFGGWPKTHKHVYQNRWLEKFLDALERNLDWINMVTFTETIEKSRPIGKIYLPGGSYREMTEWVLPTRSQHEYEDFVHEMKAQDRYEAAKPFIRGSVWKNFFAKYPESNHMYSKMRFVSSLVESMDKKSKEYISARAELYRGQCNCPYWHGVFGGLYLPYLRNAIYEHLIEAEKKALAHLAKKGKAIKDAEELDFEHDGSTTLRLSNGKLGVYVKPDRGACITELDFFEKNFNVLNTFARYEEAYHRKLPRAVLAKEDDDESASIHDLVLTKELGLEKKLRYDRHLRDSMVDHFIPSSTGVDDFLNASYQELGDFANGKYSHCIERPKGKVKAQADCRASFSRESFVTVNDRRFAVEMNKEIVLPAKESAVRITYRIKNLAQEMLTEVSFAPEFNFAFLAGGELDRFIKTSEGERLTPLRKVVRQLPAQKTIGIYEGWRRFSCELEFGNPVPVWTYPVETVSLSEGGFESVYQSTVFMPVYELNLEPGAEIEIHMTLKVTDF